MKIAYPVSFEPQTEGGFTVTFPDFPEATTEGDTIEQARFNAAERLSLALDVRMDLEYSIPLPLPSEKVELVEPDAATQAAFLVHITRESGHKSLSELAYALGSLAFCQKVGKPPSFANHQTIGTDGSGAWEAFGIVIR